MLIYLILFFYGVGLLDFNEFKGYYLLRKIGGTEYVCY